MLALSTILLTLAFLGGGYICVAAIAGFTENPYYQRAAWLVAAAFPLSAVCYHFA